MSNTLELWAVPPGVLVAELANPTLSPEHVDFGGYSFMAEELRARWPQLAGRVAQAIASGGGELEEEAVYVSVVLQQVGRFIGSMDYSVVEGGEFLSDYGGPVLGADVIEKMAERPIAGLTSGDYPWFGWVGPAELTAALAGPTPDLSRTAGLDPAEIRDLQTLWDSAQQAHQLGHDLVCLYC